MHTARIWMASATPGGAPGYDDDKEFGNNITHLTDQTSQRLRGTYCPSLKSQATGPQSAQIYSLARFFVSGERNLLVPAMRGLIPHGEEAPLRRLEP